MINQLLLETNGINATEPKAMPDANSGANGHYGETIRYTTNDGKTGWITIE